VTDVSGTAVTITWRALPGHDHLRGAGGRGQQDRCPGAQRLRIVSARARVSSYLAMGAFNQPAPRPRPHDPIPPVWRMFCRCSFRAGRLGEIAACGCRFWWRVGRRGQWYAISRRRALRALLPELMGELGHFEVTGDWPGA